MNRKQEIYTFLRLMNRNSSSFNQQTGRTVALPTRRESLMEATSLFKIEQLLGPEVATELENADALGVLTIEGVANESLPRGSPLSHPIRVLDWGNFSALRREVVCTASPTPASMPVGIRKGHKKCKRSEAACTLNAILPLSGTSEHPFAPLRGGGPVPEWKGSRRWCVMATIEVGQQREREKIGSLWFFLVQVQCWHEGFRVFSCSMLEKMKRRRPCKEENGGRGNEENDEVDGKILRRLVDGVVVRRRLCVRMVMRWLGLIVVEDDLVVAAWKMTLRLVAERRGG
ncbi:hypothetical protein LR48_Vigan09g046800 [Vigna angularis]|uniref:Uncharacterized protein n=1 Tax=Phaseolus angularis TaxID=3914 RepID=A0A0L9VAX5_PHAAN|nr:hypothetical protein LR48_Vigan09g046800 [Vigna angularis]